MNHFCVFDFETDMLDTSKCGISQMACVMIDPYNLEIISGSEFFSKVRPVDIDKPDYLCSERQKTINWHCRERNIDQQTLLKEWRDSPSEDVVWPQFVNHVGLYNKDARKAKKFAPIPAGINIINFDLPIANRLNTTYKISKLFYDYEPMDLRFLANIWLRWDTSLSSRSMDTLRKYFSMQTANAHNALVDVRQEAILISKFLKLHKELFKKINFRNSLKDVQIETNV